MTTPSVAEPTRRLRSPKPLGKLLPRIKRFRGRLAIAALCLVVAAAVGLAFPQVVRHLLDRRAQRLRLDRPAATALASRLKIPSVLYSGESIEEAYSLTQRWRRGRAIRSRVRLANSAAPSTAMDAERTPTKGNNPDPSGTRDMAT